MFVWCLCGVCVEFVWCLCDVCVVFVWCSCGVCVVFVWCLCGVLRTSTASTAGLHALTVRIIARHTLCTNGTTSATSCCSLRAQITCLLSLRTGGLSQSGFAWFIKGYCEVFLWYLSAVHLSHTVVSVWCLCDICVVFVWCVCGVCVVCVWCVCGVCVVYVWCMCGFNVWCMSGVCAVFVWCLCGVCVVFVWCMSGACVVRS